jgi:hypothetical protein
MLSLLDQAAVSNHIWHTAHVPSNIAAWLCSLVNLPTYLPDGPDLPPPFKLGSYAFTVCHLSLPDTHVPSVRLMAACILCLSLLAP